MDPLAFDDFEQKLDHVHRALLGGRAFAGKLEATAEIAKMLIADCDGAGFALEVRRKARSLGVTDEVVLEVDLVQYDTGEGPCLAAIDTSEVVHIDLVRDGEAWSHFAPGAIDAGINSVLSMPLIIDGSTVGALNLYSRAREAFDQDAQTLAAALAAYAAEVVAKSPLYAYSVELVNDVLERICATEMINGAVGLVMAGEGCDAAQAHARLASRARARSETLLEAAEWELREHQMHSGGGRSEGARVAKHRPSDHG